MPALSTHNVKAAAVTSRDGLRFVFTTTLPSRRDSDDDLYHDAPARRKAR
jgi:hypothetical protein